MSGLIMKSFFGRSVVPSPVGDVYCRCGQSNDMKS